VIAPRISGVFSVSTRPAWDRKWYESLGWRSVREDNIFVPYPVGRMSFALWSLGSAGPNIAAVVASQGSCAGTLLCMVVDSADEVGSTLGAVESAGGRVIVADHEVVFGRSGWFLDPAGTTWEVCWINGRNSETPFAGGPNSGAVPADLCGVTIATDDPLRLEQFYSEGLGWADHHSEFAGLPGFALEGGNLNFADSSWVPAFSTGPVPILRSNDLGSPATVVERLVGAGATRLPAPDARGHGLVEWVADPFGLCWQVLGTD
jgi:catechol 2,3-dioxygenase-like lactoylglutathione lyase family enzyme